MTADGAWQRRWRDTSAALRAFCLRCDWQTAFIAAALLALGTLLLVDLRGTLHFSPSISRRGRELQLTRHQSRLRASMSAYINSNMLPRPQLSDFLSQSCVHVADEHDQLVTNYLKPWAESRIMANTTRTWPVKRLYTSNDSIYLHPELAHDRLVPTFLFQLEVKLSWAL